MSESKWGLDDCVCITACLIMIVMSAYSFFEMNKLSYEINTGLFCGIACLFPLILKPLHVMTLSVWFNVMIAITIFIHANGVLMMSYDTLVFYDTLTHTLLPTPLTQQMKLSTTWFDSYMTHYN